MTEPAWRSLYPFESHWHPLAAGRYHYLDEGQGAPILMVHGNPTWSFYWRRLILAFRDRYRTIVPDHLGAGLSDKPQAHRYCLSDHIDNLVSLVDQLDLRHITLLGHDWGGAIGLGAALQRPDRFSRFVMFNTGAFPPPFIPWRIRVCHLPLVGQWALRQANLFSLAALRMAVNDRQCLDGATRAGLIAPYDSWAHRVGVWNFVRDIPTSPSQPTWQRLATIEAGLQSLADRPWRLIWGMRDWCFRPECLTRIQQHVPQAEVDRFDDVGHWIIEEAPQRVIASLDEFLRRTDRVLASESPTAR